MKANQSIFPVLLNTENNRILPKTTECYRKLIYPKYRKLSKLPKTTPDWFLLMLECTEKYQSRYTDIDKIRTNMHSKID